MYRSQTRLTKTTRYNERKGISQDELENSGNYHQNTTNEEVCSTVARVSAELWGIIRVNEHGCSTAFSGPSPAHKVTGDWGQAHA
jgi:hypothetical protein